MEIWQDALGYEGLYQVSDLGRVKSIRTGKILVVDHGKYGHGQVCFSVNGKKRKVSVHRAVLEAFKCLTYCQMIGNNKKQIKCFPFDMIRSGKVWKHV